MKEALLARGWCETEAAADGALSFSVWPAVGGVVVVELTDWDNVDVELATAFSQQPVASFEPNRRS